MDFELRAAKTKWEKEQKEKKERARKRLEQEKKARDEAAKRQQAIEDAQRIRRMEESAAALAAAEQEQEDLEAGDGIIYNRVFTAFSVPGKGDKIRLPLSSFEQLSSQSAIDKGPMFFEVSARSASTNMEGDGEAGSRARSTHAGVLEFTAEEGVVELPPHVWRNAGFTDPEYLSSSRTPEARVRYVRLPKGTYAKLQPEGRDFADVLNHKAVLETAEMAITDGSGLCLSSFLSARLIPFIGNGPILTVFENVYIFREIENELRLSFQNEVPVKVSLEGMKEFLCKFFAPLVVESVVLNFLEIEDSFLGQAYFLWGGLSMLGLRILKDIREEFNVLWEASRDVGGPAPHDQDSEWTVVTRSKSKLTSQEGGSSSQEVARRDFDSCGRSGGARRGGGGRGGRNGRRSDYEGEDTTFFGVVAVDVVLPPFHTLDKRILPMPEVRRTIGERSGLFDVHVQGLLVDSSVAGACFYDPELVEDGYTYLFHGMRQSSWPRFRRIGIHPIYSPNEFSMDKAFYVTNLMRHAFEHPLHDHPRRNMEDFIAVLVFIIPVLVLHGIAPPPGGGDPFCVKWFQGANAEWERFCMMNLCTIDMGINHSYDIVIGPSCLPTGGQSIRLLEIGGLGPTQVAFCTERVRNWISSTATTIYMERYHG